MAMFPAASINKSQDISSAFTFNTTYVQEYSAKLIGGLVILNLRLKSGVVDETNIGSVASQYAPTELTRGVLFDRSNGHANGFVVTNNNFMINYLGTTTVGNNFGQVVYPIA